MLLLTLALVLDLWIGEPAWLWQRFAHPVVLLGKVIEWFDGKRDRFFDQKLPFLSKKGQFLGGKDGQSLFLGGVLLVFFLILSVFLGKVVSLLGPLGWPIELALVAILVAQKSLYEHGENVLRSLQNDGLDAGRQSVSMIVGRDVSQLDEAGVCKAGVESLAENYSDGVVAPIFWYLVAGLPGIIFYKAVNTADSMIGHRNEQYEYFGKAAARLDDWMNWPPARLSALLVCLVTLFDKGISVFEPFWKTVARDAPLHRSPNAGWPESAFAFALDICLGGARRYGAALVDGAQLNPDGRKQISLSDLQKALGLVWRCYMLTIGLLILFSLF